MNYSIITFTCLYLFAISVTAQNPVIIPPDSEPADAGFRFIKNNGQIVDIEGQLRPDILYHANRGTAKSYFSTDKVHFVHQKIDDLSTIDTLLRVDMLFVGANKSPIISNLEPTSDHVNYLFGYLENPVLKVPQYQRIQYAEIWPNIDVQFYSNGNGLKTYFIVHPAKHDEIEGGDPDQIQLAYLGVDDVSLSINGKFLSISTPFGTHLQPSPKAFQLVNSKVTPVPVKFVQTGKRQIGFSVSKAFNPKFPLIIQIDAGPAKKVPQQTGEPEWSTYFGHTGDDAAHDITVDSSDNIFITGSTESSNFPDNPGVTEFFEQPLGGLDAFIAKFDKDAELKWSTYYGGTINDEGYGITWTANDKLFCTGVGSNLNFYTLDPGGNAYFQPTGSFVSIFIARFDPANGYPEWSSFFAGDASYATDIAHDDQNNIYITGWMSGASGIGDNDKISPCDAPQNGGIPLCNPGGGAYFQDYHAGGDVFFFADAFIAKFNPSGQLTWSTLFGGESDDLIYGISVDNVTGHLYITGNSNSMTASDNPCGVPGNNGFPFCDPGNNAYFDDGFTGGASDITLAKFSLNGELKWSTYIGGLHEDGATNVATNLSGDVYITGYTSTSQYSSVSCGVPNDQAFPKCASGTQFIQPSFGGGVNDNFIMKFNHDAELKWSTFIGGDGREDPEVFGSGEPAITCDQDENLYLVGTSYSPGASGGVSLPVKKNPGLYHQPENTDAAKGNYGIGDAYIMRFSRDEEQQWATYFGGLGHSSGNVIGDHGTKIATYLNNKMYIIGGTYSKQDFPLRCPNTANPYCQPANTVGPNNSDAYIAKFDLANITLKEQFHENQPALNFRIYPNPADQFVHVQIPVLEQQGVTIIIKNVLGETVYYKNFLLNFGNINQYIPLDGIPIGIYFLSVQIDEIISTQKFIYQ